MVFIFNFVELSLNKKQNNAPPLKLWQHAVNTISSNENYLTYSLNNFTIIITGNISRVQRYINKYNLEISELWSPRKSPPINRTEIKMAIITNPVYIKTPGETCLTNVRHITKGSINNPNVLQNRKI